MSVTRSRAGRDINVFNITIGQDGDGDDRRSHDVHDESAPIQPTTEDGDPTEGLRRCLVVLVHGLYGDAIKSWRDMHDALVSECSHSFSLYSFPYPAGLFECADLEEAATDLEAVLRTDLPQFENYVFVCHSAGGIITKRALLANAEIAQMTHPLICRTRRIVNVGVPHHGATEQVTRAANRSYRGLRFATVVPFKLIRCITLGKSNLGENKIIRQLSYNDPKLVRLEARFQQLINEHRSSGLPAPESFDFVGRRDRIIAPCPTRERRELNVEHSRGKGFFTLGYHLRSDRKEQHGVAPVVSAVISAIDATWDWRNFIVNHTVIHNSELDRRAGIRTLLRGVDGSQDQIETDLLNAVMPPARTGLIVVTGRAGVGKSTVLRSLARRLAAMRLQGDVHAPLPIGVHLRTIDLSAELASQLKGDVASQTTARVLLSEWVAWANDVAHNNMSNVLSRSPRMPLRSVVEYDALDTELSSAPGVLILDGIDEFLLKYSISLDDFLELVDLIAKRHQKKEQLLSIVLGIRDRPMSSDTVTFRLLPPSPEEAVRICPALSHVLPRLVDEDIRTTLLTPLVLTNICPWLTSLVAEGPEAIDRVFATHHATRGQLLHHALRSIIDSRATLGPFGVTKLEPCLDVLAAVAFGAYEAAARERSGFFFGAQTVAEIDEALLTIRDRWVNSLAFNGDLRDSIVDAIDDARDGQLENLLDNTVFFPAGRRRYQFQHDSWQLFLVARYMKRAIEVGMIGEFDRVVCLAEVVYMASDQLYRTLTGSASGTEEEFTRFVDGLIDHLVGRLDGAPGAIAPANIFAILCGNEQGWLPDQVAEKVLSVAERLPPAAALVSINAIVHLALFDADHPLMVTPKRVADISRPHLRRIIGAEVPALIRSLASSYLAAVDRREPDQQTLVCATDREGTARLLSHSGSQELGGTEAHMLQWALLSLVGTINMRDMRDSRAIASVHYLAMMAAGLQDGLIADQLKPRLLELVAPEGDYIRLLKSIPSSTLRRLVVGVFEVARSWCRID